MWGRSKNPLISHWSKPLILPFGCVPQKHPNGQYADKNVTYQYNFTLPPCFSNPILNLTIRADNRAWVYLNTNNFVGKTVDYPGFSMLGTSTGFRSGMNSLTVVVHDDGGITGFDLVGNVTAK